MILSVRDLYFSYPKKNILHNINFSIEEGDCLAVLGTNGAGKSTLLKCLNKILEPQSGHIYLNNKDISELNGSYIAQNIAYVPQKHQYSRKTVFDSVLLGRKPYIKWNVDNEDMKIVENVLNLLELEDCSLSYTNELSGGELQKVVIARALAQEPKILLMDEPTSNLDLKNQIEVLKIVDEIIETQKISAIITMHDLNLALRFANKFLLLKDGEIFDFGDSIVINPKSIKEVYGVDVFIEEYSGIPMVIPI